MGTETSVTEYSLPASEDELATMPEEDDESVDDDDNETELF